MITLPDDESNEGRPPFRVPGNGKWMTNSDRVLPAIRETVELMLYSDSKLRRGVFLWNGFWMLEDGTIVGDGCVAAWRTRY